MKDRGTAWVAVANINTTFGAVCINKKGARRTTLNRAVMLSLGRKLNKDCKREPHPLAHSAVWDKALLMGRRKPRRIRAGVFSLENNDMSFRLHAI